MKTLKKGKELKRMGDSTQKEKMVIDNMISNGWSYTTKSEWKKENKIEETSEAPKKNEKKKSKKGA